MSSSDEHPPRAGTISGARPRLPEIAGLLLLVLGAVYALASSWRRWPDPVIDAGYQLYTAWRLSEGAVLYRDVDCLYGPLSSHVNALLFRLVGPGMMVLVWANLLVYAAILFLAYRLLRAAYGGLAAWLSCVLFVGAFSFNQLLPVGNYTYALPYAHEATHGVLLTLALVWAVRRWSGRARLADVVGVGLLFGLALVLRPEVILAAVFLVAAGLVLRRRAGLGLRAAEVTAGGAAALLPMLFFTLWLQRGFSFTSALRWANQAWLAPLFEGGSAYIWKGFLGTDAPVQNLAALGVATLLFWAGSFATWFGARQWRRGLIVAAPLAVVPSLLALAAVDWTRTASVLPLTLLLMVAMRSRAALKRPAATGSVPPLAWLLGLAAFALLSRMLLQPRVYHYGFTQAALAAMLVVAELAHWLGCATRGSRLPRWVVLGSLGLVIVGAAVDLQSRSRGIFNLRTQAVGQGRDRFLALAPPHDELPAFLDAAVRELGRLPPGRVLVIPEGLMVNYLARRISPASEWSFFDLTLAQGKEQRLVRELAASPPRFVVLLSRDLREHGILRFGAAGQPGAELMAFIRANFRVRQRWGGDPFDRDARGVVLLERV